MAFGENWERKDLIEAVNTANLSPKPENIPLQKISPNLDTKRIQQEIQQLQTEHLEKIKQELPALAEQIKHSVTFNAYIGELEQAVLTKNQTKKAESIKYFKEHSDLKSTLEQNVQKLASSSKESYDKLELLQIQLYGYLFLDEGIAIDGNKGVQTNLVIEALQENENMNLEALTKKITRILQRYSKSSIRKNVIWKLLQTAKQKFKNTESSEEDQWKDNTQLQQIIQKKKQKMKLTTEEIVMFQIYGNVFFDEAILVDGIEGTQTKDVGNILTKQGTLSERAKEWKEKAEANQKEKATLNAQSSKEISKTSFKSPLQSVNIPALLEHNPALKHLVANTGEKAEEAIQTIQQVFSYLTNYLDTTTPEQKNFLQDFTIDFTKGIHVVGSKIEITGFMKNGAYKDTPISFSYDMDSRNFAINTLLEQNANSNTFNINPTHPNKILFQLPQNLDTSKGTRPLDISPITQHNIELNIEKNRAISTMLDLFYLERQPPEYTKKDSKWLYHMFQILENSLTTLEDCRNFREVIQHLSTIIGGKIQETPPEEIKDPLKEEHHEELNISKQQDEKLASASSLLGTLFNAQKRLQDRTDLKTQDGTNNGLYLFLKRATPQITDLNSTAEGEQQKINIKEISSYLAAIEQGKEKEYQGFIKRGLKG